MTKKRQELSENFVLGKLRVSRELELWLGKLVHNKSME